MTFVVICFSFFFFLYKKPYEDFYMACVWRIISFCVIAIHMLYIRTHLSVYVPRNYIVCYENMCLQMKNHQLIYLRVKEIYIHLSLNLKGCKLWMILLLFGTLSQFSFSFVAFFFYFLVKIISANITSAIM